MLHVPSMEGLGGTLYTALKAIDEQCAAQRKQAKVCAHCASKPKRMPHIDAGNEEHTCRMGEPAGHNNHCQASDEGAWGDRVEVEKASGKQRDVLRGISVSANCLR